VGVRTDLCMGDPHVFAGKLFSSMAPKSPAPLYGSTLQPLYATYPNETRLQVGLQGFHARLSTGS
jgi:hypothetical protein